jgi:gas vesicle protein
MDFCEECENKRTDQADESYLDSLLSSVTAESDSKVEDSVEYYEKNNTPPRRASFEISHGVIKTAPAEAPVPETVPEPVVPEAIEDAVEVIPEAIEDVVDELPGAIEDVTEEIPDIVEDSAADAVDIASGLEDNIEEIAEDISEDITDAGEEITDTIEDITEDITDAAEDISADIPDIGADLTDAAEEITEDITADTGEEIPEDIPADTEEEIPEDIPADASEEISEDISADAGEDISDDIPTDIGEDIPEDIAAAADEGAESSDDTDVDELLDGLLADMDAAGAGEPEEEVEPIGEDDLSEIFAAAQQQHEDGEGEGEGEPSSDDLFDINDAVTEPDGEAADIASDAETDNAENAETTDNGSDESAAAEGDSPAEEPIVDLLDSDLTDAVLDAPDAEPAASETEELSGPDIEIELPEPEAGGEQLVDSASVDSVLDDILDTGHFLSETDLEKLGTDEAPAEASSEETLADIDNIDVDSLLDEIDSGELDKTIESLDGDAAEKKKSKKKKDKEKKSLFERLFANVVEELTPEQIEAQKAKEEAAAKKKIEDAEKKKEQKALSKEEKEKAKAEAKAAKEEEAKKKAEEKKRKAEEAKAKAQKKKEEKLALESLEVNEGRINRAGASILFVIFAVFAIFIILGTNIYYYNLSIKNAQTEFDRQHYNEAYYEVYGLRIKDKDIELYDKIMTVMYVNIQLSSYQNYMKSNNREKALDSLLKGLLRYDKYLELATLLDIEDDLNYVKSGILEALSTEFQMSEADAYDMMKYVDNVDYSAYIYELLGDYEVDYQ